MPPRGASGPAAAAAGSPEKQSRTAWWCRTAEQVSRELKVDAAVGLSDDEARARLERFGPNELAKEPGTPLWKLILEQFDDTLVKILLAAAGVSFLLAYFDGGAGAGEHPSEEGLRAFLEPAVILLILALNAAVGVWQESNAEAALDALKRLQGDAARVLRGGRLISDLPASQLVPGDVVELAAGDRVPADLRLVALKTATLRAEQASLTGEPVAVIKTPEALPPGEEDAELQSKECMLFAGTAVSNGSGTGVVVATGMATEIGKIQAQIAAVQGGGGGGGEHGGGPGGESMDTPLKRRLDEFGELLARVIFWICVLVWLINYHHFARVALAPCGQALRHRGYGPLGRALAPLFAGSPLPLARLPLCVDLARSSFSLSKATYYFKIAVALAVAAIPEGLPAVITTCLALGTRKMARRNAIVRKLPSVETLGCTTVICSDKTGTLTTNQMSAVLLVTLTDADGGGGGGEGGGGGKAGGGGGRGRSGKKGADPSFALIRELDVTGTTYDPSAGALTALEGDLAAADAALAAAAEVGAACSEATVEWSDGEGRFRAVGPPTEAALRVLAEKIGLPPCPATAKGEHAAHAAAERAAHLKGEERAALPEPVCRWYCGRLRRLALLEFDRDRKSSSVICRRLAPDVAALAGGGGEEQAPHKGGGGGGGGRSKKAGAAEDDGAAEGLAGGLRRLAQRVGSGKATASSSAAADNNSNTNNNVLLVKGAYECVLDRCDRALLPSGRVVPLTADLRAALDAAAARAARSALRLIALARRDDLPAPLASYDGSASHAAHATLADPSAAAGVESRLCFVAFAGLHDPPRPEVAQAITACSKAGIRVIVITGDNQTTAEAVCRSIGVLGPNDEGPEALAGRSFTGRAFAALSEAEQERALATGRSLVFSRAEPKQKQDVVRLLRRMGEVCAMTGDGVNDAPALALADIGVAMGVSGTEVAKEAADMVLADDDFSTIVCAVREGRAIYANMKAFIRYMISSNVGEVASIFLTAALGLPEGLVPVQLLWVNLVTDGPPATALGFNEPDPDVMDKPPRAADEPLITPWVLVRYLAVGCYVGVATVGAFAAWFLAGAGAEELGGAAALVSRSLRAVGIDLAWDGHTAVTWGQLTHWESCRAAFDGAAAAAGGGGTAPSSGLWRGFDPSLSYATSSPAGLSSSSSSPSASLVSFDHPCDYFAGQGKAKASTLSLSVLVAIEMANAFNALSEDGSLFSRATPPWANPYVFAACAVSLGLHCLILYVPALADVFSIVPLSGAEWALVALVSLPVVLLDEALKFLGRWVVAPAQARARRAEHLRHLEEHARDAQEREERARSAARLELAPLEPPLLVTDAVTGEPSLPDGSPALSSPAHRLHAPLQAAQRGLAQGRAPKLASAGTGGCYFFLDEAGAPVAVFKPCDEEPLARNNPRAAAAPPLSSSPSPLFSSSSAASSPSAAATINAGEALRRGLVPGEGAVREVAAHLLDHGGFAGVPPTALVCALISPPSCPEDNGGGAGPPGAASSSSLQRAASAASAASSSSSAASSLRPQKKVGSLQQYAKGRIVGDCEEFGPSMFPPHLTERLHRVALLDLRLANTDRNGSNLLVVRDVGSGAAAAAAAGGDKNATTNNDSNDPALLDLVPIDHGYVLPASFEDLSFEWQFWPQAAEPFSEACRRYALTQVDAERDLAVLQAHGLPLRPECRRVLRACAEVVRRGVALGLTARDLASVLSRAHPERRSPIERLSAAAVRALGGAAALGTGAAGERAYAEVLGRMAEEYMAGMVKGGDSSSKPPPPRTPTATTAGAA